MSFTDDIREAKVRFPNHIHALEEVFRKHHIDSGGKAWAAISSSEFRQDLTKVIETITNSEGAKLSFGLILAIVGAALGGVGVAAIGVPLALVGALVGIAIGNEMDSEGQTSKFIRKMKAFWKA